MAKRGLTKTYGYVTNISTARQLIYEIEWDLFSCEARNLKLFSLSFSMQDDVEVVYEKLNERVQDLRWEASSSDDIHVVHWAGIVGTASSNC